MTLSLKKAYAITESELTESSLPNIISVFIFFLHLYDVSTEVFSSPIDIQENTIPVPASSTMGFLVSANSFYFFRLINKNNYKDLYKLCVLLPANTNKTALR